MTPHTPISLCLCLSFVGLGIAASISSSEPKNSFIESKRICNVEGVSEACLETCFFDSAEDQFSIGLGLPPLGSESGILVINASLPLPYGFASLTLGEALASDGTLPRRQSVQPVQLVLFVDERVTAQADPPPLNLSHVRAQLSIDNGAGQLVPTGSSNVTVSPFTSRTENRVQIIAMFQVESLAHMPIFAMQSPVLSATFSLNPPEYLDSEKQKADLYMNGSTPINFTLDGASARAGNFSALLRVLKLDETV